MENSKEFTTLRDLAVGSVCELERPLPYGSRCKCIVVNPGEGRIVSLPDEEIDYENPDSKVVSLGEPMGSIIIWRAIDG